MIALERVLLIPASLASICIGRRLQFLDQRLRSRFEDQISFRSVSARERSQLLKTLAAPILRAESMPAFNPSRLQKRFYSQHSKHQHRLSMPEGKRSRQEVLQMMVTKTRRKSKKSKATPETGSVKDEPSAGPVKGFGKGKGPIKVESIKVESSAGQADVVSKPSGQSVSAGMQVRLDYSLTRSDTGLVVDTTSGEEPISFVVGQQEVFTAMDTAVQNMVVGETKTIPLTGGQTPFGEHLPVKVADMPVKNLPAGSQLGAQLQFQGAEGPATCRITEMNETHAILDFNHPLAGVPMTLHMTVLSCEKPENTGHVKQFVLPREERLKKLKVKSKGGMCAVCCKPATISCPDCHVVYCCQECKQKHWDNLGHRETCHLAMNDFQLDKSEPSNSVGVVELPSLSPELFQEYCKVEGRPVVLRGVFGDEFSRSMWDLDAVVKSFGEKVKMEVRFYRGAATSPDRWTDVGFCDARVMAVGNYAEMVRTGEAREVDAYITCDLMETKAESSPLGRILKDGLGDIGKLTGLQPTNAMGEHVNLWWGAPGHTEPLHCDTNDGTLVQLRGRKKVILFPASDWLNLYPFPPSSGISWAWSRISLQDVDGKSYPNVRNALPRRSEVILEEGDALFIPACWAHQITGLTEESGEASDHVLSVNRFWKTNVDRTTRWLPAEVSRVFRQSFPTGM